MITGGVYKVVAVRDMVCSSAYVIGEGDKFYIGELQYTIGKITIARQDTFGVFCFCRLESAIVFAHPGGYWDELEIKIMLVEGIGMGYIPRYIDEFWARPSWDTWTFYTVPLPNTICYPAVRPIKFVSKEDICQK